MHGIVLKLITNVQEYQNGAGQSKGQSKHIEECKEFLSLEIANSDKDVIANHTSGAWYIPINEETG
jgi:hypothetical protein